MTINFHGQGSPIFMPEPTRDGWNVNAGFDAARGEKMSQIMESNLRNSRLVAGLVENCIATRDLNNRSDLIRNLFETQQQSLQIGNHLAPHIRFEALANQLA